MIRLRRLIQRRLNSSAANIYAAPLPHLLATPTWSVRSLLPPSESATSAAKPELTSETVQHLLRLSALPAPATPEKEAELLTALHNHLHFVKAMQEADTTGVEPLARIGDDVEPEEITWEDVVKDSEEDGREMLGHGWKPLGLAAKTVGEYYVVDAKEHEADFVPEAGTEADEK